MNGGLVVQGWFDETFMSEDLRGLGHFGWKFAAILDFVQVGIDGGVIAQRLPENVGGGDGVLNGEIYADSADGRHGVRGIADTEQAGARPLAQAIDGDGQELYVVPIFPGGGAIAEERRDRGDVLGESRQTFLLERGQGVLGNYVGALPVITAVESDQNPAGAETAQSFVGIRGLAGETHPEDVDGSAQVVYFQAGFFADDGAAAIGSDD